ncbi:unnamed protein product, partial [Didymodactylos carnosus]
QQCEDFSADGDCRKFIRCFSNLRVKFTCGIGTAWDKNLKTCVHREWVESCSAKARAADEDALSNLTLSRSISEASESGVIVTPKQFACSSYCLYGGSCKVVVNAVQCQCPSNIQCQAVVIKPSPCATSPCSNGGLCQNSGASFACRCPLGFIGLTCQVRIDPCAAQPCKNGGQCIPTGTINAPKFCTPNPCMNGGKCISTKDGYKCACENGSGGILCEQIQRSADYKYCLLDCQNGGTCVYIGTTPSCRCPEGRNGRLCEKRTQFF